MLIKCLSALRSLSDPRFELLVVIVALDVKSMKTTCYKDINFNSLTLRLATHWLSDRKKYARGN